MLLLTGCPGERALDRDVNVIYTIDVGFEDMRSNIAYPQTLIVSPTDAKAMDAEESEIHTEFRTFSIRTSDVVRSTAEVEYCLVEPIVIVDAATRDVDHTIPAGTCLSNRRRLEIQLTKYPG